jgi:single-strand DNA-binding protein
MAASVNKVILLGNLGADPETRYGQSGGAITNFRLATNERFNDRSGQAQERTEWHRVVTFGKLAENCRDYLAKGRTVYVEGRIQTRTWDDKEGQKHYITEIVAQTVQFIGGGGGSGGGGRAQGGGGGGGGKPQGGGGKPQGGGDDFGPADGGADGGYDPGTPPPISDDDVPF